MRMKIKTLQKGSTLHLLWVLLPLLFFSCQGEETGTETEAGTGTPTTFVKLIDEKTITFDEMLEHELENYGVAKDDLKDYSFQLNMLRMAAQKCTAHTITYRTVTPDGRPVTASGVVYYPNSGSIRGVVEVSPLNKSKRTCVSEYVYTCEALPSLLGYVCIIPDLIGCGTTSDLPISYMQHDNVARVGADLRKAAEEFIYERYHHRLGAESILFGYSLGGSGAWALARYYAMHPELDVDVREIYAGGGAYNPAKAMDAFTATHYSDYAILPNIICSMNYYDNLNINLDDVFRGDLLQNYTEWCEGTMSVPELTQILGTDMTTYLNFDFISRDNADYVRLINNAASKAIPNDWVPAAKVRLYHSAHDTYVPTACGDELYEYLKGAGVDVTYRKYEGGHVVTGLYMTIDFVKSIAL